MGLFNFKKKNKIKKFDITRETKKFNEARYIKNEANNKIKESFIWHLNKNKDSKYFIICFDMTELLNVNIEKEWFFEIAKAIIGECEVKYYPIDENFEARITVRKI